MKRYRILRFVHFAYLLVGWIGLVSSFLICGLMTLFSFASDRSAGAAWLSVLSGIGVGLSVLFASVLALAIASIIELLFEIQARVFAIPLYPTVTPMQGYTEIQPAQPVVATPTEPPPPLLPLSPH